MYNRMKGIVGGRVSKKTIFSNILQRLKIELDGCQSAAFESLEKALVEVFDSMLNDLAMALSTQQREQTATAEETRAMDLLLSRITVVRERHAELSSTLGGLDSDPVATEAG